MWEIYEKLLKNGGFLTEILFAQSNVTQGKWISIPAKESLFSSKRYIISLSLVYL